MECRRLSWVLAILTGATMCAKADGRSADFYVSPGGSDEAPGTRPRPFATIERARDAVRERVTAGLTEDILVHVRGGAYRLPEGITFGPEDSGTKRHSITYAAYPGERVRLTGGVKVSGWRRYQASIYVADIPRDVNPKQLFENGRRMTLARSPNEGYFKTESVVKGKDRTEFVYRAGDLDPTGWDTSGARVFVWPGHDWFSRDKPMSRIDPAKRIVTMATRDGYAMKPGNRYFVHNVLALLDTPGECRLDIERGKLYAWPRKAPVSTREMIVPSAEHVISIEGEAPGRIVRNLHFEGLDIGVSNGHAVRIKNAEDCSVRFCLIENGGLNGLHVEGHARRITVYGNEVREHIRHGIELTGLGPGKPDVNYHHVVENNHIHHCGRLVGHGYGVRISQSGHNRILHNHIHHMPRYATTIKGLRYQSLRQSVKGVTFENRHDFLHSRCNLIAYNHIHHVNLDSQDTGAMESWGPGRDNVYDHNLIHGTGNTRLTLQSGMYLDDATDYFTLTNNIIYGVTGAGGDQCIFVKGIGNRIENNVLVVHPTNRSAIRSLFMAQERCDHHVYRRNIIVFEGEAEKPTGAFGHAVGNIHDRGMRLVWKVDVPASGKYQVWMRYGAENKPWGRTNMGGQTTLVAALASEEEGEPVTLENLPDTGGWGVWEWKRTGEIRLGRGGNTLTWVNVKGGGLNMDAIALCDDPRWEPKGTDLKRPARGRHLVVVQAETYLEKGGQGREGDPRAIYDFNNWSDDRVTESDWNLFWKPAGNLTIKGGPANKSFDKWLEMQNKKYDQNSVVADPEFYDLEKHDFRLKPGSPALKLGFEPIDTSRIGLKADFPGRLARE